MRTKRRRLIPEEREKRIQRAIEPVLNLFETNEFPKAVAIAALERQGGAIPADRWSLLNYLIMKKHGTDDARTFLQWKEVGRYPRKGSRAFYIVGPVTRQVPKRDEYGELMYDDQGKPQKEPIMVGVRGIPVFRLEDTARVRLYDATAGTWVAEATPFQKNISFTVLPVTDGGNFTRSISANLIAGRTYVAVVETDGEVSQSLAPFLAEMESGTSSLYTQWNTIQIQWR